ncbi:hypothetical protein PTKIN_Ptkin11bG0008600 [Pterospermum kingtungense]
MKSTTAVRSSSLSSQTLKVQTQLKLLNKPAVKSIKSPDGDIIDCIKITHQPAFDHPLLKNHTIQMTPNFHPERVFGQNKAYSKKKQGSSSRTITQMWHLNGRCPQGTIPVRRTNMDDLIRASSIRTFGKKKHGTIPQPSSANPYFISQSKHQHAVAYVYGDRYYGTKAIINVWEPKVEHPNEFSLSQIWISAGSYGRDINTIEAGWQVYPALYGDNRTRLFVYWTRDSYRTTGCYNLLCSGFIQISNEITVGGSIYPVSSYNGHQYDMSILVWKDPKEGNWWMQLENKYVVGYWPGSLFTHLSDSAWRIQWGGEVVNSRSDGGHTTTQMGSGHFPEQGFGKASFFNNIQVIDGSHNLRVPRGIYPYTTGQSNCYDIQVRKGDNWGNYFYYGGPGKNPYCP